jgi:hypothetical protein
MVIDIARTITGLDCIVDERTAKYSFSLIFVGDELKLADFDQDDRDALLSSVELVKPAHLEFIIEPVAWGDLAALGLSWEQLAREFTTWHQFEVRVVVQKKE